MAGFKKVVDQTEGYNPPLCGFATDDYLIRVNGLPRIQGMIMQRVSVSGVVLACTAALLAGCFDGDSDDDRDERPPLVQESRNVSIVSPDGTEIALTLFQPQLAEGQTAPVLLYSHSWGSSRSTSLEGDDVLEQVARRAWESGYFVVSFDARGFGESGGEVNLQDPALEGQDTKAIIDWVDANYGHHLRKQEDGDPWVGGLGLSYAGGFQLTGSLVDPRIDAIVPAVTWHDLADSLAPSGVAKSLWLTYLYAGGLSEGRVAPWIDELFDQGWEGSVSQELQAKLSEHGWSTYCSGQRSDGQGVPRVDAFFIQGINDTLFNANEAIRNFECLRESGQDSYLVVARGGHLLPNLQDGSPGDFDATVRCGAEEYSLTELAWNFLDSKLRNPEATLEIPRICVVLSDTEGLVLDQIPKGGTVFNLTTSLDLEPVDSSIADLAEDLGILLGLLDDPVEPSQFINLYEATEAGNLVGVPQIALEVQAEAGLDDPRFWVGVGVQRAGSDDPELLHDQVWPLRGAGPVSTDLIAVATPLAAGDIVGLLLYDFHPQYARSYNRDEGTLTINGTVELPLQ